jgi:cytochrome c-type biogenesis protein CcmE
MQNANWLKYALLVTAFLTAVGYLLFSGMKSSMVYYLSLEELSATPPRVGDGVRIAGWVKEGSISGSSLKGFISFVMTDGQRELPMRYQGQVPDSFQDSTEIIVEGIFRQQAVFEVSTLLARCPSKYEAFGPREEKGGNP